MRCASRSELLRRAACRENLSAIIPGRPVGPNPESITTAAEYGFRARRYAAPRNDSLLIRAQSPLRRVLHRLVLGPAHPPAELQLTRLAGLALERPFHHAAAVTQVARRRLSGDGQQLDLDVLVLAHR